MPVLVSQCVTGSLHSPTPHLAPLYSNEFSTFPTLEPVRLTVLGMGMIDSS